MAQSQRSNSYVYTHDNYNTPGTGSPATKSTKSSGGAYADYVLISNIDASNDGSFSFDGGNTFITIKHGVSLELFPAKMVSYVVKDASNGSHASIQCLYGTEY